MNVNNMLDWEQYVKQYVVVYQCQGAVLLQEIPGRVTLKWAQGMFGFHREEGAEPAPKKAGGEPDPAQLSSIRKHGPELAGNTDLLHLPREMNHLLKGWLKIIQEPEFNARQIWCPWETGTVKQTSVQKSCSAVMWIDIKNLGAGKQNF